MAEVADKVIAHLGRGEVVFQPSTRQVFDLCTATDKARRVLGWAPEIDIDEIIRRMSAT